MIPSRSHQMIRKMVIRLDFLVGYPPQNLKIPMCPSVRSRVSVIQTYLLSHWIPHLLHKKVWIGADIKTSSVQLKLSFGQYYYANTIYLQSS